MKIRYSLLTLSLLAVFGLQAQKLSPNAEALLLNRQNLERGMKFQSMSVADSVAPESVRVFLDFDNEAVLDTVKAMGGKVFMTFDRYATAELPVERLREISSLSSLRYVEMGSTVHLCNDVARSVSGVDAIHNNSYNHFPDAFTGKGIVVGMIDTGLDYDHITFRDKDGKSRIKRVWDQNRTGNPPEKFGYGAEYKTQEEMKAAGTDSQSIYHATHTAGTAAGSDRGSIYYGMAPDADIVFVSFGQNSVDIPNAVQYIFDYAESVGKPCVINMSLGSHSGPHDGRSTLDKYFEQAVGPGRILVGSVGNEGAVNMHVGKKFTATSTTLKTILSVPGGNDSKNTAVDIWGSDGSNFTVKVVLTDAKGKIIDQSAEISASSTTAVTKSFDDNADGYFNIYPSRNPTGDKPNVYMECYIKTVGDTRNFGIVVTGEDGAFVDMWNLGTKAFVSGGFRGWTAGDNVTTAGEIGGTGDAVISVGSYNAKLTYPRLADPDGLYMLNDYTPETAPLGHVSFFSSRGPTIDGRMKPDVVAPGALVISAMNGYHQYVQSIPEEMSAKTVDSSNKSHYYLWNIGTSMASPVVAGSIALWLQADPTLTPDKVRDVLSKTSYEDTENLGTLPSSDAGYGRFDAYTGLYSILQTAGIEDVVSEAADEKAWVERGSRTLCVYSAGEDSVDVYSAIGVLVGRYDLSAGVERIDASGWTPGIYIVKFAKSGSAVKIVVG